MIISQQLYQGLSVSQPIAISGFKSIDAWYGPWESLDMVNAEVSNLNLNEFKQYGVITVAVWNNDKTSVTEFWNPDATTNFVPKSLFDKESFKEELKKTFVYVEDAGDSDETVDTSDYATKDYVDTKIDELKSLHYLSDEDVQNIVDAHMASKRLRVYCGGQLNANLADKLNNDFLLNEDISVSRTLLFNNDKENVIDLNEHLIANANIDILYTEEGKSITSNVDAITVKTGTSLVINAKERVVTLKDGEKRYYNGKVTVVSGGGSTIYANGGNVIVNGGVYESLQGLDAGSGYSLIYADGTGKIEINDGYFIVNGHPEESKYQYILNAKDPDTEATITVKGGWYYNWSPANHDNNGHLEVIIPEGYTVEKIENTTFYGTPVGTWYHVVKTEQTEA